LADKLPILISVSSYPKKEKAVFYKSYKFNTNPIKNKKVVAFKILTNPDKL